MLNSICGCTKGKSNTEEPGEENMRKAEAGSDIIFMQEITAMASKSVKVALWVRLDAKPGKEAAVEQFLRSGLEIVQQEPATITWYALRLGPSTFGIFDTFPDDAGRQAHLSGKVAAALMAKAGELLSQPPKIEKVDVLAAKLT
jgi:quinol monooxygenase YgiN